MRARIVILVLGAAALLVACGSTTGALANQASVDTGCPRYQITVVQLQPNVRGVSACGQEMTYVRNCRRGRCSWSQDSRYMTLWR